MRRDVDIPETRSAQPSNAARSTRSVSWHRRTLFGEGQSTPRDVDVSEIPSEELLGGMTARSGFARLAPALAPLLPETEERRRESRRELQAAGYYQPNAGQVLAAVRYLGVMGPLVLLGLLMVWVPAPLELPVAVMLLLAPPLGWAMPGLYVKQRARARTAEIEGAMPDLLDMLNMCVSQGLTVSDSLRRISREFRPVYPALARELAIVCRQAEIGSLRQALQNFGRRIDLPDVHSFTSLLIQTEQMGTSLSGALAEYSDTMRETLRQQADERANKSAFQLLFPTVLCLMPAIYLFLLGPAVVELSDFFGEGGDRGLIDRNQRVIEELPDGP